MTTSRITRLLPIGRKRIDQVNRDIKKMWEMFDRAPNDRAVNRDKHSLIMLQFAALQIIDRLEQEKEALELQKNRFVVQKTLGWRNEGTGNC
jgi:hypothetical protein